MSITAPAPIARMVRHVRAATARDVWTSVTMVPIALCVLTVLFQALYVFYPSRGVIRWDGFDAPAHYRYFKWVLEGNDALDFRGTYTWNHFPIFYEWNVWFAEVACWFGGDTCVDVGTRIAWFLQAAFRVGALAALWATFRRLLAPRMAAAALTLCATSPRVFFATSSWNQDDYIFFFAALCMYIAVASLQDGLTLPRMLLAALAAAVGFYVKLTMLLPLAGMLLAFLMIPARRASRARKGATVALIALAMVAVNWKLISTEKGLARFFWVSGTPYPADRLNRDDMVGAYLALNAGPFLRPEPIYVRVSLADRTSQNSTATAAYLYWFELYENFQGPKRTWLHLLCVWTGTPLLGLMLWRAGRALAGLRRPATMARDELYCAVLVITSVVALFYFSLRVPFGWWPHPEYVLAGYPAGAVLLFRQLADIRRPAVFACFAALTGMHIACNLAVGVYTARHKIAMGK